MDKTFDFVTLQQLLELTCEWIKTFPERYDIIIGIPRSGMIIASIIACKLGKPLTTPTVFLRNEYWWTGKIPINNKFQNALLVDDSVTRVKGTMHQAYMTLKNAFPEMKITRAALFVTEQTKNAVDLYHTVLRPPPHRFEWNLAHVQLGRLAVDMDGVLCENCPQGVDSDEKGYIEWLKTAKPYLIPAYPIQAIITSRLEKYRSLTEEWLKKNNVKYEQLLMWNLQHKNMRTIEGHIQHKVDLLLKIKPAWFWESSYTEAKVIHEKTGLPVLCVDTMRLIK
jgi:uncharacterized HAD superfamily protein/hypoxanthine phosphoribosyltransferase